MSAQATHNFEVTDFSLLEGMGAGRYVSSRTFTAGGRAWNIRLYPDGEEDKAAYASVFLCLVGGAKDARTLLENGASVQIKNITCYFTRY